MSTTIPLGEIVEIRGGGTPSRSVEAYWGGPIPWATVKDFKSTCLDATLESITCEGVANSATNIIPAGAIIMPTRMAVGKAAINSVDLAINQDLKALLPREDVDQRFLLHFLLSKAKFLEDRAQGATVKGIKLDILRSLEFPNLRLEEQRYIAGILDKADGIRRKRDQAREMAGAFLRCAFLEMIGDPVTNPHGFKIQKVAKNLSSERPGTQSGPFGSALKKHEYVEEGIPVWGVDSVQHNEFIVTTKLFITPDKFEQLERYRVLSGDVMISRAGTVGRMCIAKPPVERSIISTNLVRVVLNLDALLPEYFVALFTYVPHRLGALKANNKDNAFTFLNPKTLRSLEIPIPPIELQLKFKRLVEETENLVERSNEQLKGFDELFSSLAQRAFRGEL